MTVSPFRRDDTPRAVASAALGDQHVAISVVIPTLNEAGRLATLLPSLAWADEVIVVDGGSSDDTRSVARRGGARVLEITGRTIAAQRNAGIDAASNHWILALDADEEVSSELRRELAALPAPRPRSSPHAFRIRSRNWHLGRELRHGPWGRDWKVRVFTRDLRFGERRVHEHLELRNDVGTLEGTLVHHPYRDLPHHVSKAATYARWAAEDLHDRGRHASWVDLLVRPPWRFVRDYILLSGWRDGGRGFVVATVSAFSVFLKYATLLTRRR